jgi:hypothetical protein
MPSSLRLCTVLAVPVSFNPFFPLIFSPIGMLAALASVIGDRPASQRTRVLALSSLFFASSSLRSACMRSSSTRS